MSKWRRFWKLSASERWTLVEALALLPATALALRVLGFARLQARLAQSTARAEITSAGDRSAALEEARSVARMVTVSSREGLREGNCLERSLALWWLLRRRGLNGQLRIGVRKREGKFEAHAWIEFEATVLNDSEEVHRHYQPFQRDLASLPAEIR